MSMEYLEQYFRYCALQKKLDAKTLKAYRIDLEQLAAYLQANGLSTNRAALEQYVEQLSARCKPATVKRKYASIRAYFHYLVYEELLDRSPVEKVRLQLRQEVVLPRLIEKDALTGILDAAYEALEASAGEHQRFFCLRDAAVLELLFACGARVSELCHLRASTLDLERQVVRIMGKGGRERWVYLCSPQVLDVLGRYRSACQARYPGAVWFFVNRDGAAQSPPKLGAAIRRTCSGIPLPPICGIIAAIFTRSKTSWATAPSKRPSAMCTPACSAKRWCSPPLIPGNISLFTLFLLLAPHLPLCQSRPCLTLPPTRNESYLFVLLQQKSRAAWHGVHRIAPLLWVSPQDSWANYGRGESYVKRRRNVGLSVPGCGHRPLCCTARIKARSQQRPCGHDTGTTARLRSCLPIRRPNSVGIPL